MYYMATVWIISACQILGIAHMKGKLLDLILDNQTYIVHKQEHHSKLVMT